MALTVKNEEVEKLAAEVAILANESKTEAIRQSLLARRDKLRAMGRGARKKHLQRYLELHVWNKIPAHLLGKPVTKQEVEDYLGFGPDGV